MPRRKSHPTMCPYLTARSGVGNDQEKRFIQVGTSLLHSKKFQYLSAAAKYLYFCMSMNAAGKFDFTFSKCDAIRYGLSYSTFLRSKNELIDSGFIRVVQNGRISRTPNRYAFTLGWKQASPAP